MTYGTGNGIYWCGSSLYNVAYYVVFGRSGVLSWCGSGIYFIGYYAIEGTVGVISWFESLSSIGDYLLNVALAILLYHPTLEDQALMENSRFEEGVRNGIVDPNALEQNRRLSQAFSQFQPI